MKTLNARQLRRMMDGQAHITVIDVLPREHHEKEHIPGALNIPVKDADFVEQVTQQVDEKIAPIVVYCASRECDLSPTAAKQLDEAGFANVSDFEGGIEEWKAQGYEVAGSAIAGKG